MNQNLIARVEQFLADEDRRHDRDVDHRALLNDVLEALRSAQRANRTATDRQYMIDALSQMLGPKGREVWSLWRAKGVQRIHTSWGPEAHKLSGEEIAEVHLKTEEAIKHAVPLDNIDQAFCGERN